MISDNEFFRRSTLLICGNLKIEKAMYDCLRYLQVFMPVKRMFLQRFDMEFRAMRTIAAVSTSEYAQMDLLTPLSVEAETSAKRVKDLDIQGVTLFDNPDKYAISREMLRFHNVGAASILHMSLIAADEPLGGLVLLSESPDSFTAEHARLLSLLKEPFAIAMSNTLRHLQVLKLQELLIDDNKYLHNEMYRITGNTIIGANFGLKNVMDQVRLVAEQDSPVLLLGETGVGKDVVANAIHHSSSRRDGPFVSVNCGAIPATLIDSELFGHEKGAYTGAVSQQRGRFERAEKGTIFLDEIAELPLDAQVRLLRVLQNREIERVGGMNKIIVDIRVIAATNNDLLRMIAENRFRQDLWYRLNVFPIHIPPLRERKMDIPALVQHFISLKTRELKLQFVPELLPGAMDRLMDYNWPGNLRELQNVIERELILSQGQPLRFQQLSPGQEHSPVGGDLTDFDQIELDQVIAAHIKKILDQTGGKVHGPDGAAALLGIKPSTLRYRMDKYGIPYGRRYS